MEESHRFDFDTLQVHAGQRPDPALRQLAERVTPSSSAAAGFLAGW